MEQPSRHPEQIANHYRKQMCFSLLSEILKEEVRQQVEQYCQRLPSMVMHDYFFATKRKTYGPSTTSEPNCRTSITNDGKFRIKLDTSNFATNELLVRPLNGQVVITGKHYISKLDCYEFFEMKRSFDVPENVDISTARGYRTPKGILIIEAAMKSDSKKAIRIEHEQGCKRTNKVFRRRKSADSLPRTASAENDVVPGLPNGKEPNLFSFMTRELQFSETPRDRASFPMTNKMNSAGIKGDNSSRATTNEDHVSSEVTKAAHSFLSVLLHDQPDFLVPPRKKTCVLPMTTRDKSTVLAPPPRREPLFHSSSNEDSISVLPLSEEYDIPIASNSSETNFISRPTDEECGILISESPEKKPGSSMSTSCEELPFPMPCLKIPHYPVHHIKTDHTTVKRNRIKRSRTPQLITYSSIKKEEPVSTTPSREHGSSESATKPTVKKVKSYELTSLKNESTSTEPETENPG